jgi:hypothetical protein
MRGDLEIGLRKVRAEARENLEDVAASIRRLESALDRISRAVGLPEGASRAQTKPARTSSGPRTSPNHSPVSHAPPASKRLSSAEADSLSLVPGVSEVKPEIRIIGNENFCVSI